jgi:hypothetical protein
VHILTVMEKIKQGVIKILLVGDVLKACI